VASPQAASPPPPQTYHPTAFEFATLLDIRDREIRALKLELEKYKLALRQLQIDYHYIQQQSRHCGADLICAASGASTCKEHENTQLLCNPASADQSEDENQANLSHRASQIIPSEGESFSAKEVLQQQASKVSCRKSTTSIGSNTSARNSTVLFNSENEDRSDGCSLAIELDEHTKDRGIDDLDDIIQDVGEIDLSLELEVASGGASERQREESDDCANEQDEDGISDGLLTSLTDAAISNLSQLAALQERCESQQQHHYQQQPRQPQLGPALLAAHGSGGVLVSSVHDAATVTTTTTTTVASSPLGHIGMGQQAGEYSSNPFSASSLASQAAIAISASAGIQSSTTISTRSKQPILSPGSISPSSNVQTEVSSSHSLASVVAAAAIAAAAANNDQHHHHHSTHQTSMGPQTRLISSAVPSPEFYHSLQQHHSHQHQHPHPHPHTHAQQNIQHSPLSSLQYSSSTSVTPSPSSLMAQSRRSVTSNTSSSLMSPIASPIYLRRQFLPDRLTLLSPSPTSGIVTGSSSGASSSLAHILHQQRSASALGVGPITPSPVSTPLGGTCGSATVSSLMSNKNSSQARLNNMQIKHKFGYLGSGRAQFNSPHGFCLGLNQEIVVADTNNHRVCIFDKSGTYLTQFGSPGKEEGQLWNPRKVAILHRQQRNGSSSTAPPTCLIAHQTQSSSLGSSSHLYHADNGNDLQQNIGAGEPLYVVCDRGAERSRMQLFTKDGAFIKKIGIHYIDIVAGLAITQNGLIIVVDSVSPTVYIINGETGILNGWFDCSGHMKEPSDIAVKSDVPGNEYFICDFKGHCVVVFSEQGEYLRKIGHDGLTSYPNGIDISDDGDILVGDSHGNRFHVVVFDRNGKLVTFTPKLI